MAIDFDAPQGQTMVAVIEAYVQPNGAWLCKLACGHTKLAHAGTTPPSCLACAHCNAKSERRGHRR